AGRRYSEFLVQALRHLDHETEEIFPVITRLMREASPEPMAVHRRRSEIQRILREGSAAMARRDPVAIERSLDEVRDVLVANHSEGQGSWYPLVDELLANPARRVKFVAAMRA